jgi:hypothetical protein
MPLIYSRYLMEVMPVWGVRTLGRVIQGPCFTSPSISPSPGRQMLQAYDVSRPTSPDTGPS